MTEIDNDLQQRLNRFADGISPEPGRGGEVIQAARTRRRFLALGAALMAIVLIGGVAGAADFLRVDNRIDPAPRPDTGRSFARYFFEVDSRDASASGVLEVNSQEGTLCYEATTENIQASHLLRHARMAGGARRFERMIVVTFFDPDDREQGAQLSAGAPICFQEEQLGELEGDLQVLIDHPEDFRVDFHRGPNDDPGLIAELKESPDHEESSDYYVDEAQNFALRLPEGWGVARRSLTPNLDDSGEILSVGTAPMRAGERCQQPVRALEALGAQDAFISIKERRDDADYPSRPRSFKKELEHRVFNIDLCTEVDEFRPYLLTFSDAGRDFYLLAALGTEASAGRTRQLWEVLDSLDFWPETGTDRVSTTARGFMQARLDGAGAEEFLGAEGWPESGPTGEPAPLYPDPPLQDFRIEFVDDLGNGTYEVGVSLIFENRTTGETLFVRERHGGFVISGARPGLEGP